MGEDDYGARLEPEQQRKLYKGTIAERDGGEDQAFDFFNNNAVRGGSAGGGVALNQEAIHDFFIDGKRVESPDLIPWGSIELIFNHKNIWSNLQHQNPAKIMYEIFDETKWRPYLSSFGDKGKSFPWLHRIGSFYHMSNLAAPISPEEIQKIETMILKDIKFTISCGRSGLNMESKFRSPVPLCPLTQKDKISTILMDYLKFLHIYECSKKSEKEISDESQKLAQKIKELIPRDYRFAYLPLRFSIADCERIR
jgi:hypothetical protein